MTPGRSEASSKGGGGEEEATPGACGRPTSPKVGRLCDNSTRRRARPRRHGERGEEPMWADSLSISTDFENGFSWNSDHRVGRHGEPSLCLRGNAHVSGPANAEPPERANAPCLPLQIRARIPLYLYFDGSFFSGAPRLAEVAARTPRSDPSEAAPADWDVGWWGVARARGVQSSTSTRICLPKRGRAPVASASGHVPSCS